MRGGKEVCNGSPLRRCAAISWLFGRAILSLRLRFSVSVLALSVTFGDSSPRGRAFGVPVRFMLDAESPTGRKRAGLATEGSGVWTSAPCQAVAGLDSGALPFPRHRALLVQTKADRHANGSPSGRAGERSETERASPGQKSFCAAISRFFVRAILSLCFYISVSILALSVIASQCHLSQRERLWQAGRRKGPPFGDCCSERGGLSDKVTVLCRHIVQNVTCAR